jgi:hypothetical protein
LPWTNLNFAGHCCRDKGGNKKSLPVVGEQVGGGVKAYLDVCTVKGDFGFADLRSAGPEWAGLEKPNLTHLRP